MPPKKKTTKTKQYKPAVTAEALLQGLTDAVRAIAYGLDGLALSIAAEGRSDSLAAMVATAINDHAQELADGLAVCKAGIDEHTFAVRELAAAIRAASPTTTPASTQSLEQVVDSIAGARAE